MASDWTNLISASSSKYRRQKEKSITYGTAGFRTLAEDLGHVVFRMGVLGALRSRACGSRAIGLMITASHNPAPDNGVKLVDPHGEMLESTWEPIATRLANCLDESLHQEILSICQHNGLNISSPATLIIARDTRESSKALRDAAVSGAEAMGARVIDHGVVTTPMLHYFVVLHNSGVEAPHPHTLYFEKLAKPFKALKQISGDRDTGSYHPELSFDGANGVGAPAMDQLRTFLGDSLTIHMFNASISTPSKLNHMCGADFVKTVGQVPEGMEAGRGRRCASVDGDADRLVYYFVDSVSHFHLLDGDRIATLLAGYLGELVKECKLDLRLGLVQTAYANGNSTRYIVDKLKMEVAVTNTGVKHLHAKAQEFDIGVYFEANGHGTILFSDRAKAAIGEAAERDRRKEETGGAGVVLQNLVELTNETVGDALSDLLLVETVLRMRGWGAEQWLSAYTDLPSILSAVTVKDRYAIVTKNAQGDCSKPDGLQDEINKLVSSFSSARAFVRASGTEDVVRVYAEAETKEAVEKLSSQVAMAVYRLADGVGQPPSVP